LYQLITEKVGYNKRAILVAPTKEEQYTYYLNKRQEYLARYQSVVDEIGDDERTFAVANATVKGIGFRHFRRFMQLPMMNLRGISIFVGGNNAGKSTLVKGLLLTMDNLKAISSKYVHEANSVPQLFFKLDANKYHDVHVGTFNRAFSNLAKRSGNEREMDFTIQIAQFEITMTIRPYEKDDLTLVPIARIQLEDISRKASFVFNFAENITEVALVLKGTSVQANIDTLPNVIHNYNMSILPTYIRSVGDMINDKKTSNAELAVLSGKTGFLQEMASELESVLTHTQIEYIYAHGINQKILFDSSDKNDYMALTLHDLVAENIDPRGREHDFICEWMQAFGIGMDYEISSIGGEAYTIQIRDGMDNMVHLADMGMGASQLLILIFRLATIIHRQQLTHAYNTTIVIEEPEQNMHPAYQSKLAVFFQTVHDKFRLNFIVETHSEYLVRRSQVLVARLQFKDDDELNEKNPFAVYYFPTDKNPYEMIYRTDGNFSNEFGTGFYDESANLLFEIL
jgi:predicted ATPase